MTEQEAQAWAAQLERVWQPVERISNKPIWTLTDELFCFDCPVADYLWVTLEQSLKVDEKEIEIWPTVGNPYLPDRPCKINYYQDGQGFAWFDYDPTPIFNEQYMPLIRRKCWLSGFNIEASAHEKAEWMRDFTHEEIEAWNLKF